MLVMQQHLKKSIIVIHSDDHQHALKEVDAAASAVASNNEQVVRILKYVIKWRIIIMKFRQFFEYWLESFRNRSWLLGNRIRMGRCS